MIEIRFVDINGFLKAMNLPLDKSVKTIEEAKKDPVFEHGVNIDGSSVTGFTPIEDSDLLLKPLPETIFQLPYTELPKLACMCEITRNGRTFAGDTRSRLKHKMKELLGENRTLKAGPEPEFFILKDNGPVDDGKYGDIFPNSEVSGLIKRFSETLTSAGIMPRVHHHEVAPAQYEIELGFDNAINVADTVVNYKGFIRALAAKNGLEATFMPKPFEGMNGNGMHLHLSLWETVSGNSTNLFSSGKPNELSDMGYKFIAGIIKHAKALTAIVSPTVNSYKRLVPGYEAPVYIAWGYRNRSAFVRVPMFTKDNLSRFEYRCPDPSCNIYLALLGVIAAGMDGINNDLKVSEPVQQNIYRMTVEERKKQNIETLPGDLHQAIECFKKDQVLQEALGEFIFNQIVEIKEQEWLEYSTQVTDWDWNRYFNV
jgi:glutamine synthetase